uniref:Uncharacterized protein n=1 Tax=Arundo donax TaxID=35708 RepID=A0A0A9ATC1_ARUDO
MQPPAHCDPEGSTPPCYPPRARKQADRHRHATTPNSDTCALQQLPARLPETGGRCRTTTRASFFSPLPNDQSSCRSEDDIRACPERGMEGETKERFLLFRRNHSAFPKPITIPVSPRQVTGRLLITPPEDYRPSASFRSQEPALERRGAARSIQGAALSDLAVARSRRLAPSSTRPGLRTPADPTAAAAAGEGA